MRRFKNKPVRAAVSCLASGFFLFHFAQGQSIPQPKLLPLPMPIFQEGQDWTVILENEGTLQFRLRKPVFKNDTVYFKVGPRESILTSDASSGFTVNFYPKTQWAVFAMRQRGAIDGVMCAFKYNAEYFKDKPKTLYGRVLYSDSNAYGFDIDELYKESKLAC